jgi:hypothetical protein
MNQLQAVALNEGLRCKKRTALQEKVVAGCRTAATGIVPVGTVG